MSRPSSIYQLPLDARGALDGWLRDPAVTQLEAASRLKALLTESHPGHAPPSKSSINRYYMSMRWAGRWRNDARMVGMQAAPGTAVAAREAGRMLGRAVARRLPSRVRMHFLAALVAELAGTPGPERQGKERK